MYTGYPYGFVRIGQAGLDPPQPQPNPQRFTIEEIGNAVKQITPTLLIVGIAAGAAFALGSGLVHRYVFKGR